MRRQDPGAAPADEGEVPQGVGADPGPPQGQQQQPLRPAESPGPNRSAGRRHREIPRISLEQKITLLAPNTYTCI